jgi:hypothetical protein
MCKNIFFENENIFEQETVDILNLLHKRREKNIHKRDIYRTKFGGFHMQPYAFLGSFSLQVTLFYSNRMQHP